MSKIKCPNCEHVMAIDLSDDATGYLTNEDEIYSKECPNCEKIFEFLVKTNVYIVVKEA